MTKSKSDFAKHGHSDALRDQFWLGVSMLPDHYVQKREHMNDFKTMEWRSHNMTEWLCHHNDDEECVSWPINSVLCPPKDDYSHRVGDEDSVAKCLTVMEGIEITHHKPEWIYFQEWVVIKGICTFQDNIIIECVHSTDEDELEATDIIFELGDWVMLDLGAYHGDIGCMFMQGCIHTDSQKPNSLAPNLKTGYFLLGLVVSEHHTGLDIYSLSVGKPHLFSWLEVHKEFKVSNFVKILAEECWGQIGCI
ncbi:hypothetical protein IW262DRAFT_1297996 [Armillaria fumosa]|nr:hypothetical protein IW262DRAFT_1297996 [Armillaria fumosa]